MHPAALQFCENVAKIHQARGPGLDIGGRDVNGSARQFWPNVNWTVIDKLVPGESYIDIPEDVTGTIGKDYTEGPINEADWASPFHVILCTEVLEHEKNWHLIIANMALDLEPGGMLVLTCAGPGRPPHSAIDGARLREDEFYRNVDPADLKSMLVAYGFNRGQVIDNYTEHDLYVLAFKD